jgi:hypothetical protein
MWVIVPAQDADGTTILSASAKVSTKLAESLEDGDGGSSGAGKDGVVDASNEQRDLHQ